MFTDQVSSPGGGPSRPHSPQLNDTQPGPSRPRLRKARGLGALPLMLATIMLTAGCASSPVTPSQVDTDSDEGQSVAEEQTPTESTTVTEPPAETSAPATDEPTEPAPTTQPEPEPEPEPEPIEAPSYSGTGAEVVILEPLGEAVFFADVTYAGSGNFALWSVDQNGQNIDLLVNEIGDYTGQVPINFSEDPAALRVEADGEWTVTFRPLHEAPRWDGAKACEAGGDAVIIVDGVADGLTPVTLTHDGDSNFAVWAWGDNGRDLIVNEIGTYDGTTLLPDGSLVLQVDADGEWTIDKDE